MNIFVPKNGSAKLPTGSIVAVSHRSQLCQGLHAADAKAGSEAIIVAESVIGNELTNCGFLQLEEIFVETPLGSEVAHPRDGHVVIAASPEQTKVGSVVILEIDEEGALHWHLPDRLQQSLPPPQARKLRAAIRSRGPSDFGETFSFSISFGKSQQHAPQGGTSKLRGVGSNIVRRVLKILLVPLVARVAREPVQDLVLAAERRVKKEFLRYLDVGSFKRACNAEFIDWKALEGKRSLLVIHGIFSSCHGMLSGLSESEFERLASLYEGRVIGFEQFTVSRSPKENAQHFLETVLSAMPSGRFTFDILCHSRGGIVARVMTELGKDLVPDHNCIFERVYFVAVPNSGSLLANPIHTLKLVDTYTSIASVIPDGLFSFSLETILAVLKGLILAGHVHLPGIAAMGTLGFIPDQLNRGGRRLSQLYGGAASNFLPGGEDRKSSFTARLAASLMHRVFKNGELLIDNDLVVPTAGVYGANGHPGFPLTKPLVFGGSDHVWHGGFFEKRATVDAIIDHFQANFPNLELK